MDEAEVDHAQHLNTLNVDRQTLKLVGNKGHELHHVVNLWQQCSNAAGYSAVNVNQVTPC